jgi:phosphonate degradation associated HDIG domain protein
MATIISPADRIAELFASEGASDYLGEPVTVAVHMLQAGFLAETAGAAAPLVAAALLHDVGHLRGANRWADGLERSGQDLMAGTDNNHSERGAAWLAQWFPTSVTEPIRLHVAAKRYLCAVESSYFGRLSEASVYTLSVQGGPMSEEESLWFERSPWAGDAVAVRRWDDLAKDPSAAVPAFDHFRPLLECLLSAA